MRTNLLKLDHAFSVLGAPSPRKCTLRGSINCVVFALVVCCCSQPLPAIAARPGEVQHVVIFWLKRPQNATDRAALAGASDKFRALPGVVRVEVGNGMPIRRPGIEQSFDMCVVFTFRNRAALERFEAGPEHRAAVESILKPLVKRYIVFNSVAG